MSKKILEKILEFSFGHLPVEDFESWLYRAKEVEGDIGNEHYVNLISVNYFEVSQCIKARIYASKVAFMLDNELWVLFYKKFINLLIDLINIEFRGVVRNGGITLHQADVLDNRGSMYDFEAASRRDLDCRWKDISQDIIRTHPFALPFLDDAGFSYYIPAYMNYILCEIQNKMKCDEWLCWNICQALNADSSQKQSRFAMFSDGQKKAISGFLMLLALSNDDDCNPEICEKALLNYWLQVAASAPINNPTLDF